MHFDSVEVARADAVGGASEHAAFGAVEPLHVLTALNAFTFTRARSWEDGASLARQAAAHLTAAEALAARPLESPDVALALAGLDECSGRLADAFEPLLLANDPEAPFTWSNDRKIVSFYRRGTAARAATAG